MIPANEANEMDTVLLLGTVRDKVKSKKSFYQLSLEMEWETLSGRRRLRWWRSWSLPAWRESSWSPLASASHHRVICVTLRRLWGWSMLECGMSTSLKRGPGECFFHSHHLLRFPTWPLPSSTYPNNCQHIFPSTTHVIRVAFSGGVTRFQIWKIQLDISKMFRDGVTSLTPESTDIFSIQTSQTGTGVWLHFPPKNILLMEYLAV